MSPSCVPSFATVARCLPPTREFWSWLEAAPSAVFTGNFGRLGALHSRPDRGSAAGSDSGSVLGEPLYAPPMSKFNNKFSFYMLMFCGVGTVFNLTLLNFGKWGA